MIHACRHESGISPSTTGLKIWPGCIVFPPRLSSRSFWPSSSPRVLSARTLLLLLLLSFDSLSARRRVSQAGDALALVLPLFFLAFFSRSFSLLRPSLSLSLSLSSTYITRAMLFHAWPTTGNRRSYRDYVHLRMLYRYTHHQLSACLSSKRRLFSLFFCTRARHHNIFSREIAQKRRRVRDDASACVFS